MGRQPDWAEAERQAITGLRTGEDFYGLLPVLLPPSDSGGGLMPSLLVPVVMAVEALQWRRAGRTVAERSRFPLATRMIFGLTDERILIWAAGRRWQIADYLGEVSLDRIVDATAPTVGAGWRSVQIFLSNEPTVTVQVPATAADDLASTLRRRV